MGLSIVGSGGIYRLWSMINLQGYSEWTLIGAIRWVC